ncbi:2-hydroxyacid dehydrogenase [Bradyrhizobium ottawaense]|uniref:2-hydroxyacid dehydrogenase n=1 Tax=Bradyrhizobium ottawaense TaxID=931866 RepID=UPI003FA076D8
MGETKNLSFGGPVSDWRLRCALISSGVVVDWLHYLGEEASRVANRIEMLDHDNNCHADVHLAVVVSRPPDDAFSHYPNLKAVCSLGAGVEKVVGCPSLPAEVHVVRVVDARQAWMMSGFVARHAINHQRGFASYQAQQRKHIWQRRPQRGADNVPIGILGYGEIGRRVAADLTHLGFPVGCWSRSPKTISGPVRSHHGSAGLAAMLEETEVLVNLLPLTSETRGILNTHVFGKMRRGGYLIQVGRGEHLVEADLLEALKSGQLAGAALDVFATEPLPPIHPFWEHPKITITPHDASDVSAHAVATMLVETAEAIHAGERPPHAINRSRSY